MNLSRPRLSILIFCFSGLLIWRGLQLLLLPPIYSLARNQNILLHYEGHILIVLALMLILSHRWLAVKLLWISQEIHRIISTLLMAGVIGIDAMMHVFNIPHMEGWWLPILGGSSLFSGAWAWLHRGRKQP